MGTGGRGDAENARQEKRDWKMRLQYAGVETADCKMRETTLYGKPFITYVSCKVQSTVPTVYSLLRLSLSLCVQIRQLRSENGIRYNTESPRFRVRSRESTA